MVVNGVDLSVNNGVLTDAHWVKVEADGKRFFYAQARKGNDNDDPMFQRYIDGAKACTSLARGAYLFAYVLPNDINHPGRSPEAQAQAFFVAANGVGCSSGDLIPAIDLEDPAPTRWAALGITTGFLDDWTGRCRDKVKSLFGCGSVLVYTYDDWGEEAKLVQVGSEPLWIASYQAVPRVIPPWTSSAMQQTSGGGLYVLPNGAKCDTDVVADEATFASLLVP
jgi:GH25 family lysozyme M1 (1,4-beta-N-acetylmuramidase)